MYKTEQNLNGKWCLYIAENKDCKAYADTLCREDELKNKGITAIEGSVPGNFELDMYAAGLIGDPFYADNPHKIQRLENRHLWYATKFDFSGEAEAAYLLFEGIDTFADVYLNGVLLGSADNMFVSHEFKAASINNGKNELLVHIKPTVIEARKYEFQMDVFTHLRYNAGSLGVRKAAHMFGWDIFPRFVSGGIWRDVLLVEKKNDYIKDFYLQTTRLENNTAQLSACYSVVLSEDFMGDYSLTVEGKCGEKRFEYNMPALWGNSGNITFTVEDPALWWPRDMGEQNLYNVTVTLRFNGDIVDTKRFDFGVRTIKLNRTDITDKDGNGEFRFEVNGEPIFIRGTNWVPMDAFHSRDAERLPRALELLYDINCNMVRCWGGNVYEDHEFFDFCDRKGILVWQDFAMGCATYPQDDDFAARFKYEVEQVVAKLRGHTSLALWAGDNECDVAWGFWGEGPCRNPNGNRLTREVIPEVLSRLDPWREYLPSSPYVSEKAYEMRDESILPENHLWGPRDYFKSDFYTTSPSHFASETGYHGCPSPESIAKFISKDNMWPWQNNDEWQMHATCVELGDDVPYAFRNALMANQIDVLFGFKPETLEDFALASQLSEGEADKFFIERFRTGKWRRTGLIWWNLVDGWPQFSDSVVDYYYVKKAAYSFIKRSQQPICLMFTEAKNGVHTLCAANEFLNQKQITYKVTDITEDKVVLEGGATLSPNGMDALDTVAFDGNKDHFYLIEWTVDGKAYKNHYMSGTVPYDYKTYVGCLKKCDLLQIEGF